MNKLNFCTLFDSNFITRGLVLYESLIRNCPDAYLYIFPMDSKCADILTDLNLRQATIVKLKDFDDGDLLRIKPTRTLVEYFWTCCPSIIYYSLNHFGLESCTYIDADLYFFSDPSVLIEEMGDKSVSIIEHRFPKGHEKFENGKYCVQFMTFKNNHEGMKVLKWWRDACIDWCYFYHEDGKFGDQKYLDDWLVRFPNIVHEIQNHGGGVAPWNDFRYNFFYQKDRLKIRDMEGVGEYSVVFYHYHSIKNDFKNDTLKLINYIPRKDIFKFVFKPYLTELESARIRIRSITSVFDTHIKPYSIFRYSTKTHILKLIGRILPFFIKNKLKKLIRKKVEFV